MTDFDGITLGIHQDYVDQYDPRLLQPIAREAGRRNLPALEWIGRDIWTAYELSWLDFNGKPQVAVAEFSFPASSHSIIESKSFKYYLNSLNQTRLSGWCELQETLVRDLGGVAGANVMVELFSLDAWMQRQGQCQPVGDPLDVMELREPVFQPDRTLLQVADVRDQRVWVSHLLKTNCPVTGQPDWASVWIGYRGQQIDPQSLLAYLVAFRQYQDFHEQCVERIFGDLWQTAELEDLWVYARYTRRGGLDINPFRSSVERPVPVLWGARQ